MLFKLLLITYLLGNATYLIGGDLENIYASFKQEAVAHHIKINRYKRTTLAVLNTKDFIEALGYSKNVRNIGGVCIEYTNNQIKVYMHSKQWYKRSYSQKEFLLFHELGHCLLDKKDDDYHDNQNIRPNTYMSTNAYLLTDEEYSLARSDLLDNLFNP